MNDIITIVKGIDPFVFDVMTCVAVFFIVKLFNNRLNAVASDARIAIDKARTLQSKIDEIEKVLHIKIDDLSSDIKEIKEHLFKMLG